MKSSTIARYAGAGLLALAISIGSAFAQAPQVSTPWFAQGKIGAGINVTSVSAATALPTAGLMAWICNPGSNDAFLAFGTDNTIAATVAGGTTLKAATCGSYNVRAFNTVYTYVAAITSAGTTTLAVETGTGNPPQQLATAGNGGNVGYVGGYDFQLPATVTVQNAAYAAGNSEGGLITLTGAARTNGGSGILMNLRIKSTGGSTNTAWLYAWSKTPVSTCTDKAAFVSSASDNAFSLPGFPQSITLGGSPGAWDTATYAQIQAINSNFKNQDASPGTALYFCLVTAGAVTPATTTDLSFVANGIQD